MNLVVLPLSGLHATGPLTIRYLIEGLLSHMIVIGLPIAYSIRHFAPSRVPAAGWQNPGYDSLAQSR